MELVKSYKGICSKQSFVGFANERFNVEESSKL